MQFCKHTLANGLTILAECNVEAHTTSVGFFVNAGARDESDDIAGVSHFLEHMAFKGTPTRSADDVNREFDEMGADYNAYTSEENTVYYASVLPEQQDRAVALLADILRPALREEDFDTEKQVIIEEIRMYQDQPPFGADDRAKARHFGSHPLGRSVIGTVDSIRQLRVEQMRAYFSRRYGPRTVTLAAAGRVDFDRLVRLAEDLCGAWEPCDALRHTPRHRSAAGGFEALHKDSAVHEYVLALADAPAATDEDRFAAKLLSVVLGDESGSRLYWELIDPGLAEHASLSYYGFQGTGLYMAYMSCDPDRAQENMLRLNEALRRAEEEAITSAELAQAKSKLASRIVLSSERPRGRLFSVGSNWINRGEYRTVRDDLQAIESVTPDQVAAVLQSYPLSRSTTIAIGPLENLAPPR